MDLVGVAKTADCAKLMFVGGELLKVLAGVSKTCDGAGRLSFIEDAAVFDGVAKILLRTAPEENALGFGALDGVSAIPGCTRVRAVALRWPVAGTTDTGA